MFSQFVQYLFSGLTVGSTYALAALGYALVYSASGVINFAQGQFIMLGAMCAVALVDAGVPFWAALPLAILITTLAGIVMGKFAIEPVRGATIITLIIITLGSGEAIRGVVQVIFGKGTHRLASFSGENPIALSGATISPQSLWVMGVTLIVVLALAYFMGKTIHGKAMRAASYNALAAQLVGINIKRVLLLSFALSAALGAIGGILITPITFTSYDSGTMLGLKGFVAAALGGLGSGPGAVVGGLSLGIIESMTAGYLSSAYKDAVAFVLVILVFLFLPRGLFGEKASDRV